MKVAERNVYAAVAKRADYSCEACGCSLHPSDGHRDHYRGRARSGTTVESVWLLCPPCDDRKTQNRPDAATWVLRWMKHCLEHGYSVEYELGATRLAVIEAKRINTWAT